MNTDTSNTSTIAVQTQSNTVSTPSASMIKPKYVKDKSVFYKKSGYLKDLLGEK